MFALSFRFPAGRYHATPWGRNVNEADVAWPPEPWRLLRVLIATWWRKGDRHLWSKDALARLIDTLAETLPVYSLPEGAIHAHTRHYMPTGGLDKGRPTTTLVFDAFLRLPMGATLVAAWPDVRLEQDQFALVQDLAHAVNYLGRAESWTECEALPDWNGAVNCRPLDSRAAGDRVRLLAPLAPTAYLTERQRITDDLKQQILSKAKRPLTEKKVDAEIKKALRSKGGHADTLPERLIDALSLDTADYQDRGWSRPPAAREIVYLRSPEAAPGVVSRRLAQRHRSRSRRQLPTVARFLLAGRPRPRIEDAVRIGELMRRAALAQFGWQRDESTARSIPMAPREISGRSADGKPLKDPAHTHAFWLPEDADDDGWIDHVSVFIAGGIDDAVRAKLDRITRLWLPPKQHVAGDEAEPGNVQEWRLALEGFGKPVDFAGGARIFAPSREWRSVTPFLAAGHLKASGYPGEVRRLLKHRGLAVADAQVTVLRDITVGGSPRRAIQFHRFRSRGRETQPDAAGALLHIVLPEPVQGPLAIGFGSHFGLGLFRAVADELNPAPCSHTS